MAEDYDIAGAIKRIEDELIASMIRNLDRHRAEEDDLGINWEQWQVKQFAALEEYRKRNLRQYADKFIDINKRIAGLITLQREAGNADQEIAILEALRKGARLYRTETGISGEFFRMNDRKMDALIRATTNDMQKAEYAMLRMSNDRYRQVIFNAQMYAASGSGTYEKAVDMATKDFLRAGINCVEYKNGARHTLSDYADMAIRTASKRAYLTGEGEKRMEWGVSTVIMNKRGNPCPKCLPFVGKVLIDDVWSSGSRKDGKYPLMSSAIAAGLYHPRCKDGHTTYFPGISDTPDDKFTRKELQTIEEQNRAEAEQQYAERQAESFDRLARYSLDDENKRRYAVRSEEWKKKDAEQEAASQSLIESAIEKWYDVADARIIKTLSNNTAIQEILSFKCNGIIHIVDGVHAVLDYSDEELKMAERLAILLKTDVSMVPRVMIPQGVSTADFIIDNKVYDLKSPTGNSKNLLYNILHKKKRQADNFIIDISKVELNEAEIMEQAESVYRNEHTRFVKELILVKDGKIVYQRKR